MQQGLRQTIHTIIENTEGQQRISVQDVLDSFQHRGFGPLLLIPALVAALPTGAIPGIPSLCALIIISLALQLVLGKKSPWLPRRLCRLSLNRDKVSTAVKRFKPGIMQVEKYTYPRFKWLTYSIANRLTALVIIGCAVSMIALEVIPFAALAPAVVIALLALAITLHDGMLTLLGLTLAGLVVLLITLLFTQ